MVSSTQDIGTESSVFRKWLELLCYCKICSNPEVLMWNSIVSILPVLCSKHFYVYFHLTNRSVFQVYLFFSFFPHPTCLSCTKHSCFRCRWTVSYTLHKFLSVENLIVRYWFAFRCGQCSNSWSLGDDVTLDEWHTSDCDFINGRDTTNIPVCKFRQRVHCRYDLRHLINLCSFGVIWSTYSLW